MSNRRDACDCGAPGDSAPVRSTLLVIVFTGVDTTVCLAALTGVARPAPARRAHRRMRRAPQMAQIRPYVLVRVENPRP
jgi:hypothetical protein